MRFMQEVRFWAFVVLCGAALLGCVAGFAWCADSGIPAAESLAKAMACAACLAAVAYSLVQIAIWGSGWDIGKVSGKLENPWEVEYQAQVANSLIRERRIG